jgi:MoaA/NifB/PqqE/SkfB family radical SAM enzyme
MFKFSELSQIHLEITNNCQASCPMCNRNINGGLNNPLIKIREWSLNEFKHTLNEEVLNQIRSFYLCGNFGDPILNDNLIDMCEWSRDVAPQTSITIHTNGGARSSSWWQRLATSLPKDHRVVFALDGLADTHHLYRVGTKYETVLENARTFISAGGIAEWVFIKFKHNEHQVEEAKKIADQEGFKYFTLKNSSRFILEPRVKVVDRKGNLTHYIEPATDVPLKFVDKKVIDRYKEITDAAVIDCVVKKNREVYIDAFGDLYPCCWLASVPYTFLDRDDAYQVRHEMLQQHYKMIESLKNINTFKSSIKKIINSEPYQTVWDRYWNDDKLITCARTCSINTNFAKPRDQVVK